MMGFPTEESRGLLQSTINESELGQDIPQPHSPTKPQQPGLSLPLTLILCLNCVLAIASLYFQALTTRALNLKSRDIDLLPRPDPYVGLKF